MDARTQQLLRQWRSRFDLRAALTGAKNEQALLVRDLSGLRYDIQQLDRRTDALKRGGPRRWWARRTGNYERRLHRLRVDRQVLADDFRTQQLRITAGKARIAGLEAELRAVEGSYATLLRHVATTEDCLQHTALGALQAVLRRTQTVGTLVREIEEALTHATALRRRINAAGKHLREHVKYHRQRKGNHKRRQVAVMDDGPAERFQQLLVGVYSAHGRFEAELRDVYREQWGCAARADRQVAEVLGVYRKHLGPSASPADLRHRRVDKELRSLRGTVTALARDLRGEQRTLKRELDGLAEARDVALRAVA